MKFDYLKQPNFNDPHKPWISRPMIPVRLSHQGKRVDIYALVDSGADTSLFHASLATALGIDFKKGRRQQLFGIAAGVAVDAYYHMITLQVLGAPASLQIDVGFTESRGVGALLGESGFFDAYQIRFEKSKERMELLPVREK
jgi:gag-polyprotein putative aspartyl protease